MPRDISNDTVDLIVNSDNGPYNVPYIGLSWADDSREWAMHVTCQVPDQPDDQWDPNLIADGQPFVLRAGPPNAPSEPCRGRFKGHGFGLSAGEPLTPRGYSLLYDMLNSREDIAYPDKTTGEFIIRDLCTQYGIPISTIDGPDVDVGPLVGRRKQIADVLVEVLQRARGAGNGSWVVRWSSSGLEVVRPGQNKTIFHFVEGESILGGTGDSSIEQLITRVKIVRLETTDSLTLQRDAYGRFVANDQKATKANEITTLHGLEGLGVVQEVVYAKKGQTDEEAVGLGQAVLDMYGSPIVSATVIVPLLPEIQKGDQHHVEGGWFDGYMFVVGYTADAGNRTMSLELQSSWKDPFPQAALALDPEADTNTLPPAGATGYNSTTDIPHQDTGWHCSAASSAWMLRSIGINVSEDQMVAALGNKINSDVGLTDGSGAGLAATIKEKYNVNTRASAVSWQDVQTMAGKQPMCMGGQVFNHWVGVRSVVDNNTISIANPAPGYDGIGSTMTQTEFNKLGPFYAVWVAQ
jgi:hypothetical protein